MILFLQTIITSYIRPEEGFDWGSVFENAVQISALLFAIHSFKNTNRSTAKFQKAETRKNWFLSIIIQPNLDKITGFYDRTFDYLEKSVSILNDYKNGAGFDSQTFNERKTKEIASFQKERNSLSFSFIEMVNSYDRGLNIKLLQCLNELEDIYVLTLDVPDYSELDMYEVESSIHQNKAKFFNHLFLEVNKDLDSIKL